MKTFFLSLFVLFLLAFAGAAAFLVTTLEPASFMKEAERFGVFEIVEKYLPALASLSGLPDLQEKAEEQLGLCRFMSFPDLKVSTSVGRVTELRNERVPFLEPITLDNRSLQCKFNGTGKSLLLVPPAKTELSIRRSLHRSGTITFNSGELLAYSDGLDVFFAFDGIEIHFRSSGPAVLKLRDKNDPAPYSVYIVSGQVDITTRRLPGVSPNASVKFTVGPGAQLSINGRVSKLAELNLLPGGFEGIGTEEFNASAPPEAPPSTSAEIRDELLHDPIHRPVVAKLVTIASELPGKALRIRLAAVFPSLFGYPFACKFTPNGTDAKPAGVLPGEWVEAPAGGQLHCPDHFDLALAADTRLRVRQSEGEPFFSLERGEVKADFGDEEFQFATTSYAARLKGHGNHQQITFTSLGSRQILDCGIGEVSAYFGASESAPNPTLSSRECRLDITSAEGPTRTLFGNERLKFGNLGIAREFLPFLDFSLLSTFTDFKFLSKIMLTAAPGGAGKMTVSLASQFEKQNCKLYGKKKDLDQPNLIRSFEGHDGMSLQMDPQYVPGFAAIVCSDGNSEAASPFAATVTQ